MANQVYRGLVATFQAFQHGVGAFMATRLLLGLCESGFIPAGLFTITRWYKTSETSKRFAFFFIGNGFAQAVAGLLAYGILHMRGTGGLAGWQWLFIIEGLFTVVVGVIFALLFPSSPTNPVNLLKRRYFTERESYILVQRVLRDDPSKHEKSKNVTSAELKRVVSLLVIGGCPDNPYLLVLVHKLETHCSYPYHDLWSRAFFSSVELRTDSSKGVRLRPFKVECHGQHWTVDQFVHDNLMGHTCVSNHLVIF
jgi:MFS family permease